MTKLKYLLLICFSLFWLGFSTASAYSSIFCFNMGYGELCPGCTLGPAYDCEGHTCYPVNPPQPPPPPPPVHGACNPAVNRQSFFGQPTGNPVSLCSAGRATAVTGDGSVTTPWAWYCNGYDGGSDSSQCTATKLPSTAASCSVAPACPTTANVNETVTWTASVSSGTGYTYRWTGDEFVQRKTTAVVSGAYKTSVPRIKTANVEITDSQLNTVNVDCPTACTNGSTGGGIEITNNGVCNSAIDEKVLSSVPNTNKLCSSKNGFEDFETIEPDNYWGENKLGWKWICVGADPVLDTSDECEAWLNPLDDTLGECSLSMDPDYNQVNINTNTGWQVTPTSTRSVIWKIEDANGTIYPAVTEYTLNKIFTTVGLKTVSAKIASTTTGVYGAPCSATTTVVLQGGGIGEQ